MPAPWTMGADLAEIASCMAAMDAGLCDAKSDLNDRIDIVAAVLLCHLKEDYGHEAEIIRCPLQSWQIYFRLDCSKRV